MRSVFDSTKMTSRAIDDAVLDRVTKGESVYAIDEQLLKSLAPDLIITQEPLRGLRNSVERGGKDNCDSESKAENSFLDATQSRRSPRRCTKGREGDGKIRSCKRNRAETPGTRQILVREACSDPLVTRPTVFCMEWLESVYCSGHWMPEPVDYAGGKEVLGRFGEPSTVVDWDDVLEADPEVIFVTVCGYDVKRTLTEISTLTQKLGWYELQAMKESKVFVLDSPAYYSRSGPRLVDGLEIMAYLMHPELFPHYKLPEFSAYSLNERRFI